MNTALLSTRSGVLADLAVRCGLRLAAWGLQREARRTDHDRLLRRLAARAAAESALAERDALLRAAAFPPF